MFRVYLPPMNGKLAGWLRRTIWTAEQDRASLFATRDEAQAAIEKARQFHMSRVMRAARIVPVETTEAAQ